MHITYIHKIALLFSIVFTLIGCSNEKKNVFKYTNDLITETSPYLLQHAHNPVNWKAWNEETLALAKKENKLIIVSIGYSACHWCHVMEEESFENDTIAKMMNADFISIKVDREERPDVDQIYINAVQLMTGKAGWPLNCILLPDGKPIYGGTYFTKDEWKNVLIEISDLYKNNPEKAIAYAEKLTDGIKKSGLIELKTSDSTLDKKALKNIITNWKSDLDFNNGGKKRAPKFPLPNNLSYLMRYAIQTENDSLKNYVILTLNKMHYGGLYDQLEGGFSRYSVDDTWHIPHFEKMLYDNAQLVSLYSEAYLVTKNEEYKNVVFETLAFIEDQMMHQNGAFYSSIYANSKNQSDDIEEGAYYVWKKEALETLLKDDFNLFQSYYNINIQSEWENNNYVLLRTDSNAEFCKQHNITADALKSKLNKWRTVLLSERKKRDIPKLDDKTLTSWNGLMLKAYIDAYRVFDNKHYLNIALKNAEFLVNNQLKNDGGLFHNYKSNVSSIDGYALDYATVIEAFIALYQTTLDEDWLYKAKSLMDYTIIHFQDEESKMFFFSDKNATDLITKKIEVFDNVIPSSNSILANNLFKLGHYYGDKDYASLSKQMLKNIESDIAKSPFAFSNWSNLLDNYVNPYFEVALSGKDALEKLNTFEAHYLPNILIAGSTTDSEIPLMKNRYYADNTYIYICVNGTCKLPLTDVDTAIKQLK